MLQKDRVAEINRYKSMLDRLEEMNKISKLQSYYCRKRVAACDTCALSFGIQKIIGVNACANLNHPYAEAVINARRLKKNLELLIKTVESDIIKTRSANRKKGRNG